MIPPGLHSHRAPGLPGVRCSHGQLRRTDRATASGTHLEGGSTQDDRRRRPEIDRECRSDPPIPRRLRCDIRCELENRALVDRLVAERVPELPVSRNVDISGLGIDVQAFSADRSGPFVASSRSSAKGLKGSSSRFQLIAPRAAVYRGRRTAGIPPPKYGRGASIPGRQSVGGNNRETTSSPAARTRASARGVR